MGCHVRNYLIKQAQEYNTLNSSLSERAVFAGDIESLQTLGLDSAIRIATVRGIELFTDSEALQNELFEEKPEAKDV